MKGLLILIIFSFFTAEAIARIPLLETFSNHKCTHSYQNQWNIVSKLDNNLYEITFSTTGPHHNWGRAILKFNSIQYTSKGRIRDWIFAKLIGRKDIRNKDGFKRKFDLLEESVECKTIWQLYDFQDDNNSYPRLGKKATTKLKVVYDKYQQDQKQEALVKSEKLKSPIRKRIKTSLLKHMSFSGYNKFIKYKCVKTNLIWKSKWFSQDGYTGYYLVSLPKKNNLGFTTESPVIDFITYSKKIFQIDSGKKEKSTPIFKYSKTCQDIYNLNPSKKILKRRNLKKKKESLYE